MIYFLDTDVCIFALKGRFPAIKKWIQSLTPDRIKIPSIVKAELLLGAEKSVFLKQARAVVEAFLNPFEIVAFDDPCVSFYSKIRSEMEKKGISIGPNDLLIASTVLAHHGTLVTHNVKEFGRIPNLKVQDWTGES